MSGGLDGLMEAVFPVIPGWDVAGVVAALGPDTPEFAIGDEVIAYARKDTVGAGTFAELVAVPAVAVARKPASLTFEQAAGLPLAGGTALRTLDALEVSEGDVVLDPRRGRWRRRLRGPDRGGAGRPGDRNGVGGQPRLPARAGCRAGRVRRRGRRPHPDPRPGRGGRGRRLRGWSAGDQPGGPGRRRPAGVRRRSGRDRARRTLDLGATRRCRDRAAGRPGRRGQADRRGGADLRAGRGRRRRSR